MLRRRSSRERGIMVPMLALFILVLMIMAALAIDAAVLYTARTSAQHAADAAALAGAFTFLDPMSTQPQSAIDRAIAVAGANTILKDQVVITPSDVNVDIPNRRVTVTVPRLGANGISVYFARVWGWTKSDLLTRATAEASGAPEATYCLKPVFLPNTILTQLDPVTGACSPSLPTGPQVLFTTPDNLGAWASSQIYSASNPVLNIRPTQPSSALQPGQFYSLDFGDGGSTYRCALGQCLSSCGVTTPIQCGQGLPLETGNMVGPTRQGINDLLNSPPDLWAGLSGNNSWQFQIGGSAGPLSDTSQQLVVAPVWDNCPNPPDPYGQTVVSGTRGQKVNVIGFVKMFVTGMSGGNVQAHIAGAISCEDWAAANQPSPPTGPYAVPVRLVQNP